MHITAATPELVRQAVAILGTEGITDDEIESKVLDRAIDQMLARRLFDWLPEAFGFVLVPHISKVQLPTTFSARKKSGEWVQFPLEREPIVALSVTLASQMYHSEERPAFSRVALRSSAVDAVNRALSEGSDLEGATLSGPALNGVPAEIYSPRSVSFWRRLTGYGD